MGVKFYETVREVRAKLGLSQGVMASLVGVSKAYICKLEKGKVRNPPSNAFLVRFAAQFDLDCDRLYLECGRLPDGMEGEIAEKLLKEKDSE